MVKILVDSHTRDTDDELKLRIDYRYEQMFENATYNLFQSETAKMWALFSIFKTASNNAKDGGTPLTKLKNKAKAELVEYLSLFNRQIEVEANKRPQEEAEAFASDSGADLQKPRGTTKKVALTYLETPAGFKVTNDDQTGAVLLKWNRVNGARTYLIQVLDKEGVWQNCLFCDQITLLLQGTEAEVKKTYRIRAIGQGTLVSDFTEGVSVWVR